MCYFNHMYIYKYILYEAELVYFVLHATKIKLPFQDIFLLATYLQYLYLYHPGDYMVLIDLHWVCLSVC